MIPQSVVGGNTYVVSRTSEGVYSICSPLPEAVVSRPSEAAQRPLIHFLIYAQETTYVLLNI